MSSVCSMDQLAASTLCHARLVLHGSVRIECKLQLQNFGTVGHGCFVSVLDIYAWLLGLAVFRTVHALGLGCSALVEKVYVWVSGLMYKMRGEVALLAVVGATIVEMSMVLEVIVAYNEGITVLMLSLVTNMVIGVFLNIGMIEKAIMESMDEGRSAEIILLLRPSAGMGNNDK
jgi:purine nucleoside phosphorylase